MRMSSGLVPFASHDSKARGMSSQILAKVLKAPYVRGQSKANISRKSKRADWKSNTHLYLVDVTRLYELHEAAQSI